MPSWVNMHEPKEDSVPFGCKIVSHVLEVSGGKLYRTIVFNSSEAVSVTQTFVPDA